MKKDARLKGLFQKSWPTHRESGILASLHVSITASTFRQTSRAQSFTSVLGDAEEKRLMRRSRTPCRSSTRAIPSSRIARYRR